MLKKIAVLFILAGCVLSACAKQHWKGYVTASKYDANVQYKEIGDFPSREACQTAAIQALQDMNAVFTGSYVCGVDCKVSQSDPAEMECDS